MNPVPKKSLVTFLIIGILFGTLIPYFSADALIGDIVGTGECAIRNKLKNYLKDVLSGITNSIKSILAGAIRTALSFIPGGSFISGLFGGGGPQQVKEVGNQAGKEQVEDVVSRCITRQALTRMNRGILDIVRTGGPDGGPAYVRNWRDFTLQSQYRGENVWRGLLYIAVNGTPDSNVDPVLCRHIRESQTFQSLRPSPVPNLIRIMPNRRVDSLQEYIVAAKCDPVVDKNYDVFMQDFAAGGGWDTFERLLQPQNNIFGATELTLAELEKQRSLEEKIATNEVISGQGFLGVRGDNASDSCLATDSLGKCIVYKNIRSPGFVIGESVVQAAVKSELDWLVSVDEMSELLTDMFFVVVARLKNLGAEDSGIPPVEVQPDVGGSITLDPTEACLESCFQSEDSDLNACISVCYGEGEGNGNGEESSRSGPAPNPNYPGVCATDEEIEQFLENNPGDEGRLPSAFPCP